MEIKELKTKIKITFPDESEIFMAEEFLAAINEQDLTQKEVEIDMSSITSIDTVFLQILISLVKTVKQNGQKISIKTADVLNNTMNAYGLNIDELTGGI